MHRHPVESSNIAAIGYDADSRTLEVEFKSGSTHQFHDVDPRTHAQLVGAKSVGSHFHQHVRGSYKSTDVTKDA